MIPCAHACRRLRQTFIAKWRKASGSERANDQLSIGSLCDLPGVAPHAPVSDDSRDIAYVFERRVRLAHGDGSDSLGFIDCYKRSQSLAEPMLERG